MTRFVSCSPDMGARGRVSAARLDRIAGHNILRNKTEARRRRSGKSWQ